MFQRKLARGRRMAERNPEHIARGDRGSQAPQVLQLLAAMGTRDEKEQQEMPSRVGCGQTDRRSFYRAEVQRGTHRTFHRETVEGREKKDETDAANDDQRRAGDQQATLS